VDVIGINKTGWGEYWPDQKYFVCVSNDRLDDVNNHAITWEKAMFSCAHKSFRVPEPYPRDIVWVSMPLPDDYFSLAGKVCVFNPDLTKPTRKTFGGMFALQVALFLGYTEIYLLGYDGGVANFTGVTRGDNITWDYHDKCFWHPRYWLCLDNNNKAIVYNSGKPETKITEFQFKEVPVEDA
jgi:hypothetical protein